MGKAKYFLARFRSTKRVVLSTSYSLPHERLFGETWCVTAEYCRVKGNMAFASLPNSVKWERNMGL